MPAPHTMALIRICLSSSAARRRGGVPHVTQRQPQRAANVAGIEAAVEAERLGLIRTHLQRGAYPWFGVIRSEEAQNGRGDEYLAQYVQAAAAALAAQGWKVLRRQDGPAAAWHVIARKGAKVRIVQVVVPATPAAVRQQGRARLGETARLPTGLGTMEQ